MSATAADSKDWQGMEAATAKAPRDSLSPRSAHSFVGQYVHQVQDCLGCQTGEHEVGLVGSYGFEGKSGPHDSHFTSQSDTYSFTTTTTTTPAEMARNNATCSPRYALARNHRPFKLELDDSRGASSVSPSELRQLIKQTAAFQGTKISSRIQVLQYTEVQSPLPARGRKRYPRPDLNEASIRLRQPAALPLQARSMGNQQSQLRGHVTNSSSEDQSYPARRQKHPVDRSVSALSPKKIVGKPSPVAHKLTTTVIEVPRAATESNVDFINGDDRASSSESAPDDKENKPPRHIKTFSEASPLLSSPSSPVTITEELAARPMSAGTTITGLSVQSQDEVASPNALRVSALSPTIPAPSPMPEDSPHQYGLKDFVDTPTPPHDLAKMERRSTGVDLFNEAKSLQSTTSFLNGLSNARRRAESQAKRGDSAHRTNKTYLPNTSATSLANTPSSYDPPPAFASMTHLPITASSSPTTNSRPITPKLDDLSRTLGHTHKSSGFAYAKPLSLMQLKCYRNHDRLVRSGNRIYQVECAVCHKDEPDCYYWSCSWCALRMCEICRCDFHKHGNKSLNEKIRNAEYGSQE